jgi:hypothetical protein
MNELMPKTKFPRIDPEPEEVRLPLPRPTPPQRGFLQTVGLAPTTAASAIAVDLVLFSGDVASMGLLLPFSLVSAGVLGWISYRWQRRWGDDHELALTKAVLVGLLTAIPAPITWLFAGPAGVAGIIKNMRGKQ